jgi:alpha-ketoglutarate-dependent taurine dioxygenase
MTKDDLGVQPLSEGIGVDITGIDFHEEVDEPTAKRLRDLLAQHSVLRFRGQKLSTEDQVRALGYFAPVTPNPAGNLFALVSNKEQDASVPFGRLPFHSDLMWTDHPLEITSLYGIELEQPVESTTFASTLSPYRKLDAELQAELANLVAFNVNDASPFRKGHRDPDILHIEREGAPEGAEHPVVMRHPRSGAPLLTVSEMMTKEIRGVAAPRSEELLDALFALMYAPENLYEQQWEIDDFVIWDNFGAQHGRPNVSATGNVRTLRKVNAGGAVMNFKGTYTAAGSSGAMM